MIRYWGSDSWWIHFCVKKRRLVWIWNMLPTYFLGYPKKWVAKRWSRCKWVRVRLDPCEVIIMLRNVMDVNMELLHLLECNCGFKTNRLFAKKTPRISRGRWVRPQLFSDTAVSLWINRHVSRKTSSSNGTLWTRGVYLEVVFKLSEARYISTGWGVNRGKSSRSQNLLICQAPCHSCSHNRVTSRIVFALIPRYSNWLDSIGTGTVENDFAWCLDPLNDPFF
jgi:hypothetical protein